MNVAILGASDNPERYAHMAFRLLQDYGHTVFPVNPDLDEIDDVPVMAKLGDIKTPIDTLTLYVRPQISSKLQADIVALKPGRVIFNPGTENSELQNVLKAAKIEFEEACTLVLLRTEQF